MKILRDKEKKEETDEEKRLKDYKKARNVGLATLGTGALATIISRFPKNSSDESKGYNNYPNKESGKKDYKKLLLGGLITAATGAGLGTVGAIKYRKLKKKLEKENKEKENDNTEKKD